MPNSSLESVYRGVEKREFCAASLLPNSGVHGHIEAMQACRHYAHSLDPALRYVALRDASLTCAQKLTRVSLIYRTDRQLKSVERERKKRKSKNGYAQKCR